MLRKGQTNLRLGLHICFMLLSQCVNGATILEIDLINYDTNSGNKADNTACTPVPCDTTFYFCVDLSCGSDSPDSCAYAKYLSAPIAGNSFDFTDNIGGVANPILVPFDDWPGLILFKVDIYDDNAADRDGWIDQMHEFLEVLPALAQMSAVSEMRLIEGMRSNNPTQSESPYSCQYSKYRSTHYSQIGKLVTFGDEINGGIANPIVMIHKAWQNRVLFKVDILEDYGGVDVPDDWIDQMHEFLTIKPSNVWEELTIVGMRPNDPTFLNITYTAYCEADHYGPQCDVLCVDSDDDVNGHYTCHSDTGEKICMPGWTNVDTNCTVSMDDCVDNGCQNYGFCEDLHQGYECHCLCGTTGTFCETNIDDCASFPCQNGATCVDGFDKFTCQCPPSFTGTLCDMPARNMPTI